MTRHRRVLPVAFATLVVGGLVSGGIAPAHFDTAEYTYESCHKRLDPLTAVFLGGDQGSPDHVAIHTGHHGEFNNQSGSTQDFYDHGSCDEFDTQVADDGGFSTRTHMRLQEMADRDRKNRRVVFGTPHFEDVTNDGDCDADAPAGHAVRGNKEESGSGFDMGRRTMVDHFTGQKDHQIRDHTDWGNTATMTQCDGMEAGSNGVVAWITVPEHRDN